MRWKETGNYLLLLTSGNRSIQNHLESEEKGQNRRKSGREIEKWSREQSKEWLFVEEAKYEKISK